MKNTLSGSKLVVIKIWPILNPESFILLLDVIEFSDSKYVVFHLYLMLFRSYKQISWSMLQDSAEGTGRPSRPNGLGIICSALTSNYPEEQTESHRTVVLTLMWIHFATDRNSQSTWEQNDHCKYEQSEDFLQPVGLLKKGQIFSRLLLQNPFPYQNYIHFHQKMRTVADESNGENL